MSADLAGREGTAGFPIVGIGASAGGLEAFLEFFRALPLPSGMAFVLVTHLEPSHASQLVPIVGSATRMHVVSATDQQRAEPDHLYILPPKLQVTIQDGRLHLAPRAEGTPHYPINLFFESLAKDQGQNAVGIILSGGGSDGAQGLRAIKSRYGMALCQAPETAQQTGMPDSAIATGSIDVVLPPAELATALLQLNKKAPLAPGGADGEFDRSSAEYKDFSAILQLLKLSHEVDFTQYKPSTVSRRINRRAAIQRCNSLGAYLDFLENHPNELNELYRDILICVTSFFREPEMFQQIGELITQSLPGRKPVEPIRVWVAGCATGEEVYSFAMLLTERVEHFGKSIPFQIFGTDISDSAIQRARSGIYGENIQDEISPERLRRFFTRVDSGYRINEKLRQRCIFSRQDLTADPPFSQMDIVSCRNVLIYLGSASQSRIIPTLHFCLKPGGLLVLGSAESIGPRTDLFAPVNHEHKIFAKKPASARPAMDFQMHFGVRHGSEDFLPLLPQAVAFVDLEARAARLLRDLYAPAAVIVNEALQVMHFHGQTSFYLEPTPGEASLNLLRLAKESLIFPLRGLVDRAMESKGAVEQSGIRVEQGGEAREIKLRVLPIGDKAPVFLIVFEETRNLAAGAPGAVNPAPEVSERAATALEAELDNAQKEIRHMRDQLRRAVEQHEAAIEELRAANEEGRSANEELQSTNEELRTAKEELQSSNEELTTVNDELKHRNQDLRRVTDDLTNVLGASAIPIIMVDMDRRLRSFTPAAGELLGCTASDLTKPVGDLHHVFPLPNLPKMLDAALERLESSSERAQNRRGQWFEIFVRTYRTADNRIEGAVVNFIDTDRSTRALEEAENARNFAEGIVETVQHPLLVLDQNLRILRTTRAFYETFNVRPQETEGRLLSEVGEGKWNFPELTRLLNMALIRDEPFKDLEIEHDFSNLGRRTMRLNARRIVSSREHRLLLAIEDVTERKETAEIQYRRLFESARDAVVIIESRIGQVVDINPFFSELTRYSRSEVVGRALWEVGIFNGKEEIRQLLPKVWSGQTCRVESLHVRAADGKELILELIANAYRVRDREFVQLNIRDVTDRRKMEARLRSSNLDLQQFAFAASHDLQEPLRAVTAFSDLLRQRLAGQLHDDIKVAQYLDFITSAADRMSRMVLDLLAYSEIVKSEVRPSKTNAEATLSSVLLNLQMAIQHSQARVTFDSLPSVVVEPTHLAQLLQNLIGNAIKYRSELPPQIHISATETPTEHIFSISDNGIGVDVEHAEQVFTIFRRLHGAKYPGSGVGLAICKRIVERYGGRIWVEPGGDRGSVFCFTLPKEGKA